MRIAILGTGAMAAALGGGWVRAGHDVVVAGRSPDRAHVLATALGTRAVPVGEAVTGADAVLLAVAHTGVADVLRAAGATTGALTGTTLIDPVNAMDHGGGPLRVPGGGSHAQRVAALAPGAHVVKAFHLFPSTRWTEPASEPLTVPLCGDDAAALRTTGRLVRDLGAEPVVFGDLSRARQLEETAGFVISLAFTGIDPASAVPSMPAAG
ncbi:putative oxidoreductase [Nocardia nova SH22a]|uniref:Putative oxidoreductase n=1 Tax=Nocardia nova SH22a TaxID=1415166 RepID=W5TIL3_9NOCA|nr:NAD(P)-binding domain-containing protein [Nocardia nova]AHH17076.1 putative oxidoreductase [Nocardia nova SH22a]